MPIKKLDVFKDTLYYDFFGVICIMSVRLNVVWMLLQA